MKYYWFYKSFPFLFGISSFLKKCSFWNIFFSFKIHRTILENISCFPSKISFFPSESLFPSAKSLFLLFALLSVWIVFFIFQIFSTSLNKFIFVWKLSSVSLKMIFEKYPHFKFNLFYHLIILSSKTSSFSIENTSLSLKPPLHSKKIS